jgi:Rad3-related DNA helicase
MALLERWPHLSRIGVFYLAAGSWHQMPWPRPDLLHQARRGRFGGKAYDDATARARIAQAFGRLIRRADDKGVFVMLDPAAPTRLFSSLPRRRAPRAHGPGGRD